MSIIKLYKRPTIILHLLRDEVPPGGVERRVIRPGYIAAVGLTRVVFVNIGRTDFELTVERGVCRDV